MSFGERIVFMLAVFIVAAIALARAGFHPVAVFVVADAAAVIAYILGGWRYDGTA